MKNLREKSSVWKVSIILFILSIITFAASLGIATSNFKGTIQETSFGNSEQFIYIMLGSFGIGVISFLIAVTTFSYKYNKGELKSEVRSIPYSIVKFLLTIAFLPIILIFNILNLKKVFFDIKSNGLSKTFNSKSLIAKTFQTIFISVLLLPFWVGGYFLLGMIAGSFLGYVSEDIAIVGTGSMYPTWPRGTKGKEPKELAKEIISTAGFLPFPNGLKINDKRIFGHTLERGDIITWSNDVTKALTSQNDGEPAGLLKRIIGLSGDTIELRNGILYLNSQPQKEPYTAKPRSTFGEKFLKECQVVTVPEGEFFAMGDNRKGSADSREIGFAPIKDINRVLPMSKQKDKLDKNWRDTTLDLDESIKPKIDKEKFLELLNNIRKEKGVSELKYQTKLEKSAELRGKAILKYEDFEQKKYTMEKSMADAGYWNTFWWEVPIQGYYEADELIENYLERDWTDAKETWFDKRFDDIGVAEVEGSLNGCPTQIIVIHVAGYVPPNYKQSDIDSWKPSLDGLRNIQSGWANLKNNVSFYSQHKSEIDRINEIISIRITRTNSIISTMTENKWLSVEQNRWIKEDQDLYNEQESLANKLNSK
ncbi:signal peptidase I [Candidatus Woesebacteria bacterium RIFOXYC1_FULL_31_51]|uniref:Signal peptidase I n=1 Tax=Candidatus Woesebacteria bacterium GW2011_GWC2_31_9 TaxID=1618586 RepID=A0A0G0BKR0_9BACT|nr:MAG: signal peptidase I [Candidatus Woesebacteria bacterium GW2011_GWF1_31_35]KKP23098.1 MAG: Signal peptidase I [Candidatus Woesebacteria bacterium GW2011_GWC1_30_29]KKP26786.1 MAG: Signal peptidase I [Candidatus Woesebacteria bacterium GW2011_GWD1_31_12]KKP27361.1 MAG: Signal peptidase I [Candidatus Woesebacteria bacterium GW2011_GWB1_31_29]KKP31612.1 MAG: Signal peptidase I [Candidatus Woesebacteria bacterium GW2011_GWC2_31_9]KKP33727.1 MAG: Signal peptidase I [Candidatus Woesebacteria b